MTTPDLAGVMMQIGSQQAALTSIGINRYNELPAAGFSETISEQVAAHLIIKLTEKSIET